VAGELWQVDFSDAAPTSSAASRISSPPTELQSWRARAHHLRNGKYFVSLAEETLSALVGTLTVSITLGWSTDKPDYLDDGWNQIGMEVQPYGNPAVIFRPCVMPESAEHAVRIAAWETKQNHTVGCDGARMSSPSPYPSRFDRMRCYMEPLRKRTHQLRVDSAQRANWRTHAERAAIPTSSLSKHACTNGAAGRWITAAGCLRSEQSERLCGGRAAVPKDDPSWRVWVPWGCTARASCGGASALECIGARRLLLLGDSVLMGMFLDLCSLFGGGAVCRVTRNARDTAAVLRDPTAKVIFTSLFGIPARRGFANLFFSSRKSNSAREWAMTFTKATNTIVILNSGLHDIAQPIGRDRRAPLSHYASHLSLLVAMLKKAIGGNPTLSFVFRATSHSPIFNTSLCRTHAFPNLHAEAVDRLNAMARRATSKFNVRVHFWSEPAIMSYSAPREAFRDTVHFDFCGRGADYLSPTTKAGRCALEMMSPPANASSENLTAAASSGYMHRGWAEGGGLSKAITQTLFGLPMFNCACARLQQGDSSGYSLQ